MPIGSLLDYTSGIGIPVGVPIGIPRKAKQAVFLLAKDPGRPQQPVPISQANGSISSVYFHAVGDNLPYYIRCHTHGWIGAENREHSEQGH